jgi:hypothetical protein
VKPKKRREYLKVRQEHWVKLYSRSSHPAQFLAANKKPGSNKK